MSKLVVRDTGVDDFSELSRALTANHRAALSVLDLSYNKLSKASVAALCRAVRARNTGLRTLLLRKVNLTTDGAVALVHSFEANFAATLALEHLDLSLNALGGAGSEALCHFLAMIKGFGRLAWLDLSRTALDVAAVTPVLGVLLTLRHVDLSDNVAPDTTDVADALAALARLPLAQYVSLAGMKLSGECVSTVLKAAKVRKRLSIPTDNH